MRFSPVYHCYVGVALRRGARGNAEHVSRVRACWADIDAKLWSGADRPKSAALDAITTFPLRPSIVDSGGGFQPYWLLHRPLALADRQARNRLEAVNTALARAVCGPDLTPDHVHDVARVLRTPSTLNHKPEYGTPRPVTIVWCEPDTHFALAALEAELATHFPWAFRPPPLRLRPLSRPDASQSPSATAHSSPWPAQLHTVSPRASRLADGTGPDGYQSSSEADAALVATLMGAGLSDAEVRSIVLASVRGHDALARKGRHGEAYWDRTIANAAAHVGQVTVRATGLRTRTGAGARRLRTQITGVSVRWQS